MLVRQDLTYLMCSLPAPEALPGWDDLLSLHRDLIKAKSIDGDITRGAVLALMDSRLETFEKAQGLIEFLDARAAIKTKLASATPPWIETLHKRLADMQPGDPVLHALTAVCADVRALEHKRRELVARAVDLPEDAELNEDYAEALSRLTSGKSAFALPFGKSDARNHPPQSRHPGDPGRHAPESMAGITRNHRPTWAEYAPGELPPITYVSGGLESARIRKYVCDLLEGGEEAFKERARRLRVRLDR